MAALARSSAVGREVFDAASDMADIDLRSLCERGPAPVLNATENAQPAIFATSAALHRMLGDEGVRPIVAAGHSVGELNALVAAGVLSFEAALRLVVARGRLMARAKAVGGMVAVVGLGEAALRQCCERAAASGTVVVAVCNSPSQFVLSGAVDAVAAAAAHARQAGALRLVPLATSNAFHSPLFDELADEWAELVGQVAFNPPAIPVALNVTGELAKDAHDARTALIRQITGQVRWADCVWSLAQQQPDALVECGDSHVLSGFSRQTTPWLTVIPAQSIVTPALAAAGGSRR